MGHTPFGYRIENGVAVIDEDAAGKLRTLYANYLDGMSLKNAAIEAGIEAYHASAKRLLMTKHYLGDDFYPAIIDKETFDRVLCKKDDFLQTLRANIATVVLQGDALSPEVIDERLSKLQKDLLKKVNQKDDYDAIADEILRLRDQRRQAEVDSVIKDEQMKQIRELQDFVKKQPSTIAEFDETLVKRLIAKITVFENKFTVDFKSGITIDIEG